MKSKILLLGLALNVAGEALDYSALNPTFNMAISTDDYVRDYEAAQSKSDMMKEALRKQANYIQAGIQSYGAPFHGLINFNYNSKPILNWLDKLCALMNKPEINYQGFNETIATMISTTYLNILSNTLAELTEKNDKPYAYRSFALLSPNFTKIASELIAAFSEQLNKLPVSYETKEKLQTQFVNLLQAPVEYQTIDTQALKNLIAMIPDALSAFLSPEDYSSALTELNQVLSALDSEEFSVSIDAFNTTFGFITEEEARSFLQPEITSLKTLDTFNGDIFRVQRLSPTDDQLSRLYDALEIFQFGEKKLERDRGIVYAYSIYNHIYSLLSKEYDDTKKLSRMTLNALTQAHDVINEMSYAGASVPVFVKNNNKHENHRSYTDSNPQIYLQQEMDQLAALMYMHPENTQNLESSLNYVHNNFLTLEESTDEIKQKILNDIKPYNTMTTSGIISDNLYKYDTENIFINTAIEYANTHRYALNIDPLTSYSLAKLGIHTYQTFSNLTNDVEGGEFTEQYLKTYNALETYSDKIQAQEQKKQEEMLAQIEQMQAQLTAQANEMERAQMQQTATTETEQAQAQAE